MSDFVFNASGLEIERDDKTVMSWFKNEPMTFDFNVDVDQYNKLVEGIWGKENPKLNKEEKEMYTNRIVNLYYDRKIENLRKVFKEIEEQEIEKNEIVKKYNDLITNFKIEMTLLADEEDARDVIGKTGYDYEFAYQIDDGFRNKIHDEMVEKFNADVKPILDEKEEVLALLDISDDKDYVIDVLTKRGIIDKKFNMVEE